MSTISETFVVVSAENLSQFLENVKKAYPGLTDKAKGIIIIDRGLWDTKNGSLHQVPLSKGERIKFY